MTNPNHPTIDKIRNDCCLLDGTDFVIPEHVRLISHETFTSAPEISVKTIIPDWWAKFFCWCRLIYDLFFAFQLFLAAKKGTVLIINGSRERLWLFLGFLNQCPLFRKRVMLLWDVFVEYQLGRERRFCFFPFLKFKTTWKEKVARFALMGFDLSVLWSKKQVPAHAEYFQIPEEKFIYLPYKANHSQYGQYDISMGRFIFAGGNGKRDYKCLVDAVRGTEIPVIISATDPVVRKQIDFLPNVMVLGASEPAFAQLQAASEFIVVPMNDSGLKGGGEANFCNAMWHGKPVIACCNMAAEDYIIEGETGFVVPSGDSKLLQKKILELWNDPERVRKMGRQARKHAEKHFTQEIFIRRLLRLAFVLGDESIR